jgi:hypothetical protein
MLLFVMVLIFSWPALISFDWSMINCNVGSISHPTSDTSCNVYSTDSLWVHFKLDLFYTITITVTVNYS